MKKGIKYILTSLIVMILCTITLTGCVANNASVFEITKQNMLNNSQNITEWENTNNNNQAINTPVTIEQEISNITVNNEYSQFSTYDNYLALKENEGYEGTFSDFLNEYVYNSSTISNPVEACVNSRLMSVVSIIAEFHSLSSSYPYRETNKTTDFSAGSGVIYKLDKENGDAYIITNYHVIYSGSYYTSDLTKVTCNNVANRIICYLYGTSLNVENIGTADDGYNTYSYGPYAIECEFLGGSANYDIAVLKVCNSEILKTSDATQISIKNCSDIIVGERAIVIGNPEANGFSATAGIVSVDSEYITMTNVYNVTQQIRVVRIDAPVNGGNSGGGLFDVNGNLIGIVNAKLVDEEVENIGYAIPSDIAIEIADNIIKNCNGIDKLNVQKATLGITLKTIYTKSVYNTGTLKANIIETVAIDSITANSLADGILEKNQIIKQITIVSKDLDGNAYNKVIPITRLYQVVDSTLSLCVGDTITFTIESADGSSTSDITFTITQDSLTTID